MDITSYIEPELLITVPVLYALGAMIKRSELANRLIPLILGGMGIVLATVYSFSVSEASGAKEVLGLLFAGVTQGLLCASASVYANNIIKQMKKDADEKADEDNCEADS